MRVRSPRISDGYEESSSSPSSTNKSVQLAAFAHDSDVAVFLPRNATLSHHEEAKEGNVAASDGVEVDRVGVWVSRTWQFLAQPFTWLSMLSRELDVTFVTGVMVVYGVSQGIAYALSRVVVDYYWRDVQEKEPSTVQFYRGITVIPWDVKPLYGLLTDLLPFFGYHRRPYFVLAGLITISVYIVLVFGGKLLASTALAMFVGASASAAMADVTIDALVAMKSREKPELASHIQTLCGTCSSAGSLSGFLLSGLAVAIFGSQFALGIMLVPGILLLVLGFTIAEPRLPRHLWRSGQVGKQMKEACFTMWDTMKIAQVWQPSIYMYLTWALVPDISEGKFYWFNDFDVGPGFSEEFVGVIYAMGSVGTLLGVAIYHRYLRHWTFRRLLLWSQILLALSGMLDLVLVTRVNRKLLIPDTLFAVVDEAVSSAIARIKWMPLLVLAAKLCPPGIEGTFFALLMSIDNVGTLSSSWVGSVLLRVTGIRRTNFQYLWLTVLIRNGMRLLPLPFLFLVPNTDPDLPLLPTELLGHDNSTLPQVVETESDDDEDSETAKLADLEPSNKGTQIEQL
ncbi:hypothetical protein KC19_5G113400 [Ceratodon purpureus]|uniref:Folate-biopterin transporter 2 n=1 Tax=Ceratodon purpureus TaxID=3225 RepID=A0A8T0I1R8_CERPU|nr:hypothetical protein KC19_5G113400 [Ceratodon purpureus]